jgi:subtilisin family serine protease
MPSLDTSPTDAEYRPDQILIQFEGGSPAALHSRALDVIGGRLDAIIAGDTSDGELARVTMGNGMTVEKAVDLLSHLPGVKFAEADNILTTQAISNDTSVAAGSTWGLYGDVGTPTNIYGSQATEAWAAGYTGSSKVVVGVIDTGIDYTHPDLYLNIWLNPGEIPTALRAALADVDGDGMITFRDLNNSANGAYVSDVNANGRIDAGDLLHDVRWANGVDEDGNGYKDDLIGWDWKNNDNDPMDDAGHGTHVSGTIGAIGGNGIGVAGVGWNTQVMALKFMDASSGTTSAAIQAVDYYTNASKASPTTIFAATNNSWGGSSFNQSLLDAITRGAKQDIIFVAAAGNGGSDQIGDNNDVSPYYPSAYNTTASAGYDAVVAVAAIGANGALASWSNYGANTVDIAAPGVGIYSTTRGGGYGSMSGTSMATPHIAGAIALYAAAHPDATAAQIREALLGSAVDTTSVLDKVFSDGRLDVSAFLQTISTIAPTPTPAPAPTPTTGVVIIGSAGVDDISPSATVAGQALPTAYGDTLSGLGGADTLNGGTGADRLEGGAGDDIYVVDAGDTVVELSGEGTDLVQSAVSHTLAANVERLTLTGSAAVNGTGNDLANIILGNSANNVLFGAAGDDRLDGGSGNDTVTGGAGADTVLGGAGADRLDGGAGADLYVSGAGKDVFVLRYGEAADDSIQDFAKGDKIQLLGYSAGSTFAKAAGSSTDWVITDGSSHTTEVIHVLNAYNLKASDFIFG